LAFLPPRAKLCSRCGNPTPPALAAGPTHETSRTGDPSAEAAAAVAERPPGRATALAAVALAAIALLLALGYSSC
jgi:hypothetical protein